MQPELSNILERFPRLAFTQLPSPVFALGESPHAAPLFDNIYVKHDGKCAQTYAGNKVRKLEFLLADARQRGANRIVTLGAAGSNHAVATSTYAHQMGMTCTVCLTHQPPSAIATRNLRRHLALGTQLHVYQRYSQAIAHAESLARDPATQLIPLGGSSPLASLGYITAAAELVEQVEQGLLPRPERVYVACGTMGTAVGLALGFALLRQPIQVVAVRVTERSVASEDLFADLYARSVDLLRERVSGLTLERTIKSNRLMFVEEFFGDGYASPTPEALQAIEDAERAGLTLDGTYTGKAFAALLAHRRAGKFAGPAVFWCTLNAQDTPLAPQSALGSLGEGFSRYC